MTYLGCWLRFSVQYLIKTLQEPTVFFEIWVCPVLPLLLVFFVIFHAGSSSFRFYFQFLSAALGFCWCLAVVSEVMDVEVP